MQLTTSAKQTLISAAVIGCLFGVLAAIAAAGFDSEYGQGIYAPSRWDLRAIIVAHTVETFVEVAGGIIVIFGAVPIFISWAIARRNRSENT
jgi:hypothetical protein